MAEEKKSLKTLVEKRNTLLDQGKELAKVAETRELKDEELKKLKEYRSQVEEINNTIEGVKEFRDLEGKSAEVKDFEEKPKEDKKDDGKELRSKKEPVMHQKSPEYRALELYLRGRANTKEFRDLENAGMTAGNATAGTDGNGGLTISDTVFNNIIEKVGNISPVFSLVQQYPSVAGTLEIPRETSGVAGEGFVGELKSVPSLTAQVANLKLNPIRVGAYFQLTQSLINNSAIDIVSYAENRVAKDIARTAARNILTGKNPTESEGFSPIIGDADVATFKFSAAQPTAVDILKMHASLNQVYTGNAAWVISPAMKQVIETLQNGDGRFLFFDGNIGNNVNNQVYNLLGAPVYVDDALTGASSEILYGDLNSAYALDVQNSMSVVHVTNDTTQALNGGHLIVGNAYMDGGVQNPDAVIAGVAGSGSTSTPGK